MNVFSLQAAATEQGQLADEMADLRAKQQALDAQMQDMKLAEVDGLLPSSCAQLLTMRYGSDAQNPTEILPSVS